MIYRQAFTALALALALLGCEARRDVAAAAPAAPATQEAPRTATGAVNLDVLWISHRGIAPGSGPFGQGGVARSEPEARDAIERAAREVAAGDFAEVTRRRSDDAYTRPFGGAQGMTALAAMPPELSSVAAALAPGQVSRVIDTPHGFYLLRVRAPVRDVRLSAAAIFVTWTGADSLVPPTAPRTKEEARRLVEVARAAALVHFDAAVQLYTDDRDRALQAGWEGVWSSVADPLENYVFLTQAVLALEPGEISQVVEGFDGFRVLRRLVTVEPPVFAATEVVVAYAGARFSESAMRPVTRARDEAKAIAERLAHDMRADPRRFDEAVRDRSDSPTARFDGKRTWSKGRMYAAVDAAIERAAVGDIVGPIETPLGFAVFRRDP